MNYYTAQQTIELLNKELPHSRIPYDLPQLADLCRREVLTPVFYYSKCLDRIDPQNIAHAQPQTIEPCTFSGYLTRCSLINLIHAPATTPHSIRIDYATVYEVIKAGYKWLIDNAFSRLFIKGELVVLCGHEQAHDDRYPMTTHDLKEHDAASVTLNDLLFPSEQVQRYITTHDFADVSTPEQQRIAELESQLAQAHADNDQLRRQHSKPADDDKELQPNSQAAVTRLLNVLFHMGGHDLSAHSGTLRERLISYSKHPDLGGESISEGFLTPWLKRVQQLRIDVDDKNRGI